MEQSTNKADGNNSIAKGFRRHSLTLAGIMIGIVGLVLALIPLLSKDVRELRVVLLSTTTLISAEEELPSGIEAYFHDDQISSLAAIVLRIENAGTQPIRSSDFEHPIIIEFPEEARIIASSTSNTNPVNLLPMVETQANLVSISPLLLNEGDNFTLELQIIGLTNDEVIPIVNSRIVDIKEPPQVQRLETKEQENTTIQTMVISYLFGLIISSYFISIHKLRFSAPFTSTVSNYMLWFAVIWMSGVAFSIILLLNRGVVSAPSLVIALFLGMSFALSRRLSRTFES